MELEAASTTSTTAAVSVRSASEFGMVDSYEAALEEAVPDRR